VVKARTTPDFRIANPESLRWRASLIQNSKLVENYIRFCRGLAQRHHRGPKSLRIVQAQNVRAAA